MNGLYDAKLDGQPVLAITGLPYHDLINTHTQQDVELDRLFVDVAKYNARIMGPTHVEPVVDLACRTALTYRGVAHITIAVDIQDLDVPKKGSKRNVAHHTSDVMARSARLPSEDDLLRAADILNTGHRVAILAGQGALGACDELERLAETLAAPIVKPLLGKAAVPDDSPYTTGSIGLLGTRPSQEALEACDTLLRSARRIRHVRELSTCVPVKVIIIKNDTLGQIKWEQMVFLGNPEYGCDLHPIDFAAVARACGGTGFTIERAEDCGPILDQALAAPGPVVVQAVVDPFEPPFPPKSRWSRRRCSQNLSCAASQTARRSPSRSWATGCASSFERRAVARRSEAPMDCSLRM